MKIKKSLVIVAMLVVVLFLSSCLNYKPYQPSEGDQSSEELDLIDEIAEIERELGLGEEKITGETVKELEEAIAEEENEEKAEEEITLPLDEEVDLSNLQKIEVKENELVNLNVKISDPDKDVIDYAFSLPLNEQGKWKTNYGDAGEYVVTISATDGKLSSKKDVLLVVNRVNVPPIIKEIMDKSVKEGETVALEPQVIDPNGDPVTVTVSKPLDQGTWTTDHTNAGEYEVVITASDGELENKETFLLTVKDVNVLPEIVGLKDIAVKEGETIEVKPEVSDLDNDEITLTISEPVGNDGLWETSYTDHGEYTITITADDGKDKVTKSIKVVVKDVNMPPEIIEINLG